MKFFSLLNKEHSVHLAEDKKVIPKDEFTTFLTANELIEEMKREQEEAYAKLQEQGKKLKQKSKEKGFQEGLEKWNDQLALLEKEIHQVREDTANAIVPLALTAVKKIIGRELKNKPETVLDIVATALKPVSQHRKISIYVNKGDLNLLEENRTEIKKIFEHLETLAIAVRDDVAAGGCIIETEAGIINAQLDSQMNALESAFREFFENKKNKGLE